LTLPFSRSEICWQESRQSTKEQEEGGDEEASRGEIDKYLSAATTRHDASNDSDCDEGKSEEENGGPGRLVVEPTV
jgi:hypothetical protein